MFFLMLVLLLLTFSLFPYTTLFRSQRPVACFAWSSSAHYLGCRDRFLGWSDQARRQNIHLLAYNTRSEIGRAHVELQSHSDIVCRLLLEKKKYESYIVHDRDLLRES